MKLDAQSVMFPKLIEVTKLKFGLDFKYFYLISIQEIEVSSGSILKGVEIKEKITGTDPIDQLLADSVIIGITSENVEYCQEV